MKKRKDGKIIASLTEVKNNTGDIFALVDEYGEVTLTSYNKPRYKISKINISDMLAIEEDLTSKQNNIDSNKETVQLISSEVIKKLSNLQIFSRNSQQEILFTKNVIKKLQ